MAKKKRKQQVELIRPVEYDSVLSGMVGLLETARRTSARAVNSIMTATYWEIGRRIVELEQGGEDRAGYGEALIQRLAGDLTKRFGRGFTAPSLYRMRKFFLVYSGILSTGLINLEHGGQSKKSSTSSMIKKKASKRSKAGRKQAKRKN